MMNFNEFFKNMYEETAFSSNGVKKGVKLDLHFE